MVDREVSIKYNCFDDSDKKYARIDFVVHAPQRRCRFLLEVDEDQHKGYPIPCELSRMCQVNEAIRMGQQEDRLVWVRYNPHGFKVEGQKKVISTAQRQESLTEFLQNYEPKQDIEVCYLYYDMDHKGDLKILEDPDYNVSFTEFVTQCMT
jgi:hypothetical protein